MIQLWNLAGLYFAELNVQQINDFDLWVMKQPLFIQYKKEISYLKLLESKGEKETLFNQIDKLFTMETELKDLIKIYVNNLNNKVFNEFYDSLDVNIQPGVIGC